MIEPEDVVRLNLQQAIYTWGQSREFPNRSDNQLVAYSGDFTKGEKGIITSKLTYAQRFPEEGSSGYAFFSLKEDKYVFANIIQNGKDRVGRKRYYSHIFILNSDDLHKIGRNPFVLKEELAELSYKYRDVFEFYEKLEPAPIELVIKKVPKGFAFLNEVQNSFLFRDYNELFSNEYDKIFAFYDRVDYTGIKLSRDVVKHLENGLNMFLLSRVFNAYVSKKPFVKKIPAVNNGNVIGIVNSVLEVFYLHILQEGGPLLFFSTFASGDVKNLHLALVPDEKEGTRILVEPDADWDVLISHMRLFLEDQRTIIKKDIHIEKMERADLESAIYKLKVQKHFLEKFQVALLMKMALSSIKRENAATLIKELKNNLNELKGVKESNDTPPKMCDENLKNIYIKITQLMGSDSVKKFNNDLEHLKMAIEDELETIKHDLAKVGQPSVDISNCLKKIDNLEECIDNVQKIRVAINKTIKDKRRNLRFLQNGIPKE